MERYELFARFQPQIRSLPRVNPLPKQEILVQDFELARWKNLAQYYAPFDFINSDAKIAIIGITPGLQQMQSAFAAARDALQQGLQPEDALKTAKYAASFAGSMRSNLNSMLDALGLPALLGIQSSTQLFEERNDLLHASSAIRYPVLKNGQNYSGSSPSVLDDAMLKDQIDRRFAPELQMMSSALIIPLGKCVTEAVQYLVSSKQLDDQRCLVGFPHPSGANRHRRPQFEANQLAMIRKLERWYMRAN